MTENTENLRGSDVIRVDPPCKGSMPHNTFIVAEFMDVLMSKLVNRSDDKFNNWGKNGVEADVLVAGKLWRKGKVRLTIEFIPDEAPIESLLDEFRNKPNN